MSARRRMISFYFFLLGLMIVILSLTRWEVFPCASFRTDAAEGYINAQCPFVDEDGDFLFSLSPGYYNSIPSAQTGIMAIFLFLFLPASGAIVMHRVLRQ